jgi:thiol:disulfide interchange protein
MKPWANREADRLFALTPHFQSRYNAEAAQKPPSDTDFSMRSNRLTCILLVLGVSAGLSTIALGQPPSTLPGGFSQPGLEGLGELEGLGGLGEPSGDPVKIQAHIAATPGSPRAKVVVTATIRDKYHIYSTTQAKGGPQRTKIELKPSEAFKKIGDFETTTPPKVHIDEGPWKGLVIEEHFGRAEWIAPIEVAPGTSVEDLTIEGAVDLQACDPNICIPLLVKFTARHEASARAPAEEEPAEREPAPLAGPTVQGSYTREGSQSRLSGHIEPAAVAPGGEARLVLTITPGPSWHAYALADVEPKKGSKSTLIVVESTGRLRAGEVSTDAHVTEQEPDEVLKKIGWPMIRYYEGPVTFAVPIEVPGETPAGPRRISGIIGFQICQSDGQCEIPQAARFQGTLQIDPAAQPGGKVPLTFAAAEYADAAKAAAKRAEGATSPDLPTSRSLGGDGGQSPAPPTGQPSTGGEASNTDTSNYDLGKIELRALAPADSQKQGVATSSESSIVYYLGIAFLGGIILNLMPCVLPVIGLKIMSFVQQAGQSRAQAFALNLWYSAGILAVFLAMAILAAGAGMNMGDQFGNLSFNVVMCSLIFAMALSLLGVWEIPIPGFVGGSKTSNLMEREGPTGAFLKGVFTTILATPCLGPLMAPALGWAVAQPATTTLLVFTVLGLGMALPYLVIGAFPNLIRFIPKPGNWMVTFKQVMGFILLGSVIFFLSFMPPASLAPTVALLIGIGFACWWVSRIPITADDNRKLTGWLTAGAIVAAMAWLSFGWLYAGVLEPRLAVKKQTEENERVRTELEDLLTRLRQANSQEDFAAISSLIADKLAAIDSGPYQPFTLSKLQRFSSEEQRTVLVDFTADWCLNCKALEARVLHSEPVETAVEELDVVTMKADYTDKPEHLSKLLRALGSSGVPVVAIFPPNDPYRPIVFQGAYTRENILAALRQATGTTTATTTTVAQEREADLVARAQAP